MSWIVCTLDDICDKVDGHIQTGPFGSQLHQSDYSEVGTPVVMPKDIVNGTISEEGIARVSEEHVLRLSRHKVRTGDILFSRRGDVGRCAYISPKEQGWLCGTGCLRVTVDAKVADSKFIFYYLQQASAIDWIEKHAIGATMLNLNTGILANVPIMLPSLPTQRRIASILSAYDDLIENNRCQIKLLEEAAQRLYREWFVELRFPGHEGVKVVDGVPEGWMKRSIDDIANYLNGYAFKPADWGMEGKPIIKIKELNEGITANTPRNTGEDIPAKYIVHAGDIIFSWSATLTAMIWDSEDGLLNQHLFKVSPCTGIAREFVLQSILKALDEFANLTTGSTMKHIQRGKLKQVHVAVPDKSIMTQYEVISNQIREQILLKQKQIANLIEARDRLFPKLINGKMEVSE